MQGTGRDYVRTTPRRPRRGECFRLFSCRFGRNDMVSFILVLFMGSLEDMARVLLRQVGSACWCCERNYSTWFHGGGLIDALVSGKGGPTLLHVRFYIRWWTMNWAKAISAVEMIRLRFLWPKRKQSRQNQAFLAAATALVLQVATFRSVRKGDRRIALVSTRDYSKDSRDLESRI